MSPSDSLNISHSELLDKTQKLARELMDSFNLNDWSFQFDRGISRLGACFYEDKKISISRSFIELNPHLEEEITDTILHEIAHALNWIHNKDRGHGKNWKAICQKIGARPERLAHFSVKKPIKKRIRRNTEQKNFATPIFIQELNHSNLNPQKDKFLLINSLTGQVLRKYQRRPKRDLTHFMQRNMPNSLGKLKYVEIQYHGITAANSGRFS